MRTDGFYFYIQFEGNIMVLGFPSSHAGGTVITLVQNEISATFGGFAMKSGTSSICGF